MSPTSAAPICARLRQMQDRFKKSYSESAANRPGKPGNGKWVFRGEYSGRDLRADLEKKLELYGITDPKQKLGYEKWVIREFQRKAALCVESEPDKDDVLEWLALMQHHKAPTRLLDFSYSFYVALYFVLAAEPTGAVWAIHVDTKAQRVKKRIQTHDRLGLKRFNKLRRRFNPMNDVLGIRKVGERLDDLAIVCYLMKYPLRLVYPVSPFRRNRRLTAQQGLFLLSGDIRTSFSENLKSEFGHSEAKTRERVHKIKFLGSPEDRKRVLRELRTMNITNEALFPGIDGFARSTAELLARPLD
jgi:hypothetical protein